jgi:hypothetical protein
VGVIHPPLHPLPSREGKFSDTLQLAAGWFIFHIGRKLQDASVIIKIPSILVLKLLTVCFLGESGGVNQPSKHHLYSLKGNPCGGIMVVSNISLSEWEGNR